MEREVIVSLILTLILTAGGILLLFFGFAVKNTGLIISGCALLLVVDVFVAVTFCIFRIRQVMFADREKINLIGS